MAKKLTISDLQKQVDVLTKDNVKLSEENKTLKEKLQYTEDCRLHLSSLTDKMKSKLDSYDSQFNQETMTIPKGTKILLAFFDSIQCPITKKEVFKQFNNSVISSSEKEIEAMALAVNTLNNQRDKEIQIVNDVRSFLGRLVSGQVTN